MTKELLLKNLLVPEGVFDVVIDTDAQNEIDGQFAISYLLKSKEKLKTVALYAAPYSRHGELTAKEGIVTSFNASIARKQGQACFLRF